MLLLSIFHFCTTKTIENESRFGTRLLFVVNILAKSIRFWEPLTVQWNSSFRSFRHVICKIASLQNILVKVSIWNITALYHNLLTEYWVWFEIISSIVKLNQNFAVLLGFTQGCLVNEPLSPERIFVSPTSFRWNFFIKGLLYCKKFKCDQ